MTPSSSVHPSTFRMIQLYTMGAKWQPFSSVAAGQSIVFTPAASLASCQVEEVKGIPVLYHHPLGFRPRGVGPGGSLGQCILLGSGYDVIGLVIVVLCHDPHGQFCHHFSPLVRHGRTITPPRHLSTIEIILQCSGQL